MCSCGCNTCETKPNGPLLTEGKVKSLLSEGLQYHIDKKIPLFETVYRIGSDKHLSLIKTDIEDIMGSDDEPMFAFSNHIGQAYGIEFRSFNKSLLYKNDELTGSSTEIDFNDLK